ncbi:hypothetical protein BB558_004709 [Smittium angustum]|uniref:Nudix hydrolase domain-containing protein n=1 Tax=Smittium angustum TaxID=133377 RepID=A0A2U1J2H2_SMIAN|nr:hypothetical protein BB558_004709 [Smittium angustum]
MNSQKPTNIPHWEFIHNIATHLALLPKVQKLESKGRASVALIFCYELVANLDEYIINNFGKSYEDLNNIERVSLFSRLLESTNKTGKLLFIERATVEGDRFSGQIGYPGGKQDKGENDFETAVRETREEIGWDLGDKKEFCYLGELDDIRTTTGVINQGTGMIISPQVFLKLGGLGSKYKFDISSGEVNTINFIDLGAILEFVEDPDYFVPKSPLGKLFSGERKREKSAKDVKIEFGPEKMVIQLVGNHLTNPRKKKVVDETPNSIYKGFSWALKKLVGSYYYYCLPLKIDTRYPDLHIPRKGFKRNINMDSDLEDFDYFISEVNGKKMGKFASSSHIYLWGLSLTMLNNVIDYSLVPPSITAYKNGTVFPPKTPILIGKGYTGILGHWPLLDQKRWFDVNYFLLTAQNSKLFGFGGSPSTRKPLNLKNYGMGYENYYRLLAAGVVGGVATRSAAIYYITKLSLKFVKSLL